MEAIAIAHWPGKDTLVCETHLIKIVSVGRAMGVEVSTTPLLEPQGECTNCKNEEVKRAASASR